MADDETEDDPFAYLFKMTETSGPHLFKLHTPKNIKAASRLMLKDPARFAMLDARLERYTKHADWVRMVKHHAKTSAEDAAKERMEEDLEEKLDKARDEGRPVFDKGNVVSIAEQFAKSERPNLIHWDAYWMDWRDNRYVQLEDGVIHAEVQAYMRKGVDFNTAEPYVIGPMEVAQVTTALKNLVFRQSGQESKVKLPMWLTPLGGEPEAGYTLACRNGVLGLLDGQFDPPTPDFFTRNSVEYDYDPDAVDMPVLLNFMESVWPTNQGLAGYHDLLQEVTGYLLSPDTSLQVVIALGGVPGAGKGTILRLWEALLGERNTISRSFDDLFGDAGRFAKHDLIDKTLLTIPDAQLKKQQADDARAFILSVSGEDRFMADRKNKPAYNGPLNVRIAYAFNKDMYIPDQAGALASRLICFRFKIVFRGTTEQDTDLDKKLRAERSAILNWAMIGLRRLRARGHFLPPPDSLALLNHIKRRSAPVVSFLADVTERDAGADVKVTTLFKAFKGWHREKMGSEPWLDEVEKFAEAVYTATRIDPGRRDGMGSEPMVFDGLKIKASMVNHRWPIEVSPYDDDDEDD